MTDKREEQVAEAAKNYADENYPELILAPENERLADVAESAFRDGAVFEQAPTPTDDEREALAITDAEWREFQAIPEQGYSHRHWVDARIAERVMRDRRRPVQGEPEWEYGNEQLMHSHVEVFPASSEAVAKAQAWLYPMRRRRKAGPWEAVPAAENDEREEQS